MQLALNGHGILLLCVMVADNTIIRHCWSGLIQRGTQSAWKVGGLQSLRPLPDNLLSTILTVTTM